MQGTTNTVFGVAVRNYNFCSKKYNCKESHSFQENCFVLVLIKLTGAGAYKDGPENIFFCISGWARKFWTTLIGPDINKPKKVDEQHISGPSLYAPPPCSL